MHCDRCDDLIFGGICPSCFVKELKAQNKSMLGILVDLRVAHAELLFVWGRLKQISPSEHAKASEEAKEIREKEKSRVIEPDEPSRST